MSILSLSSLVRHALLLGLALEAGAACRSEPLSPGAPASTQASADPACAPDEANPAVEIVACGFAPTLAILGVDDAAVYVETQAGLIHRVDKATGARTKLYAIEERPLSLSPKWSGIRLHEGAIYLDEVVVTGHTGSFDIVAIDARTPTTGNPRVVVSDPMYSPEASANLIDGDRVYWDAVVHTRDGAYLGPLVSAPLGGGPAQPLTRINPSVGPIGILDGKVYFFHTADSGTPLALARVSTAGGEAETVVPALAAGSEPASAALGKDAVYLTSTAIPATVSILRYPFSGGPAVDLYDAPQGGEIPRGVPHDLVVEDGALYFVQGQADSGGLLRLPLDGGAPVGIAPSLYAPGFDAEYIYVTYTRGGTDTPIEGVIGRVPR